jgi:hypothetical protein
MKIDAAKLTCFICCTRDDLLARPMLQCNVGYSQENITLQYNTSNLPDDNSSVTQDVRYN